MSTTTAGRKAQLERTWQLMADAVVRMLEADNVTAAALNVCRQWLAENNVTLDSIRDWRHSYGFDASTLPTFNDDDEEDGKPGAAADPALVKVPPFSADD